MAALRYDDPLEREVYELVEREIKKRGSRVALSPAALHAAVSAALDPAPNGERYAVDRLPTCPNGHDPDEFVVVDGPAGPTPDRLVDVAEHSAWDALVPGEKARMIERIVADAIAHGRDRKERENEKYRRFHEMRARGDFTWV